MIKVIKLRLYKDKWFLFFIYIVDKKGSPEIAKLCKCNDQTIRNWLNKFNIPIRSFSEVQKGKILSEEHKRRISISNKIAMNRPEVRKKLRESQLGKVLTEEHKRKIGVSVRISHSRPEIRRKISKALKGIKRSEEFKRKMSETNKNEKNSSWKGDNVGYNALHDWVRRHKPKSNICEICGKEKKLTLSNTSGKYKRDINDFRWLCYSCHRKFDFYGISDTLIYD